VYPEPVPFSTNLLVNPVGTEDVVNNSNAVLDETIIELIATGVRLGMTTLVTGPFGADLLLSDIGLYGLKSVTREATALHLNETEASVSKTSEAGSVPSATL
jgi:hypothetical protein